MDTVIPGQQFGSLHVLTKDTRTDKNGRNYWIFDILPRPKGRGFLVTAFDVPNGECL